MEGCVGGAGSEERGCSVCALRCIQTYSGALSPAPTIDGILHY